MKRIFFYVFLLLSINSFARDWTFNPDSAFRHSISIKSDYFISSKAINNRFIFGLFMNEYIDNARKNSVSNKLKSLNTAGAESNTEIKYTHSNDTIFGLPHSFYSVSVSDHYHLNSTFKKDVFELVFRGNKSYAGKTADAGEFKFYQVFYQQVNFTFGHMYRRDKNIFEYSAGLSLNKGQILNHISAPKATLYTDVNGEYIDVDIDLQMHQSDSTKKDVWAWNGTGGSADFSFRWRDGKNNILKFSADNFGFIQWNKNTAFISADTAFRFEGEDVTYLFSLTDNADKKLSLDSSLVYPYLSAREKKSYLAPLPALLNLSYQYILKPGKMDLEGGLSYLFFAGSDPLESLTFSYSIKKVHRLSLKASYGGYTAFQAGLGYRVFFLKHWMFEIQSDYLSSLVNMEKGCGQGAFVSLTANF